MQTRIRTPEYKAWQKQWYKQNKKRLAAYAKVRYLKKKDHIKAYGLGYRANVRLDVLSHYGNGQCACLCCGIDNPLVLTLDHVNNDGNTHRREIGKGSKLFSGYQFYLWLKRNNYPPLPLQTLCYNCNCGRWRNGGTCPLHPTK